MFHLQQAVRRHGWWLWVFNGTDTVVFVLDPYRSRDVPEGLATMLFSVFATLQKWNLNPRTWLRWYLDACATAGGKAPTDIQPFLPWNMTEDHRRTMAEPMPAQDRKQPSDSS